jgi:hypothetical protein
MEAGETERDLLLRATGEMPEGGAGMWCSRIATTSTFATARNSGRASAANVLSSGSATTALLDPPLKAVESTSPRRSCPSWPSLRLRTCLRHLTEPRVCRRSPAGRQWG